MDFTYAALERLIGSLRSGGYDIVGYHDWEKHPRCAILRHDVDYDPFRAVELAKREAYWGVYSTFFFLVTSPLYNSFSQKCTTAIREVSSLGHEVGLHFDETCYPLLKDKPQELVGEIQREAEILSGIVGRDVRSVSMHRPSKATLDADLEIPGLTNSYGSVFFHGFKYLSDSRRRWREPVEEIITGQQYEKLHILTHAFWYTDIELDIRKTVSSFVNEACNARYESMSENITDIESIMSREEVLGWQ